MNHAEAAQKIRDAIKKFFTDDSTLIHIVANLNVNDLEGVINAYKNDLGRNIIDDIKSDTHFHFQDTLAALLTPPAAYDAQQLRKAMKGLGTNDDILCEIICTRDSRELKAIANEFKLQFGHDLEEDISNDTSGELKKLLVHRLQNASDEKGDMENDVELLYKAGQGRILGHDETVFFNVLAHRPKDYLHALNTAYANKHNKSLVHIVEHELGGGFKKGLLALVTPADQYFADKLHAAMSGIGTDDSTVIRIIASQRGPHRWLKATAEYYLAKHEKPLKARVAEACSGDFKKLLVAVLEHNVEGRRV